MAPVKRPGPPITSAQASKHHDFRLPRIYGAGHSNTQPQAVLHLATKANTASSLAELSWQAFKYRDNLNAHQKSARDAFVKCYVEALPIADELLAFQKIALEYYSEPYNIALCMPEEQYLDNCLKDMMKHLDAFFFFGNLTRVHPTDHAAFVDLRTGYGVHLGLKNNTGSLGRTYTRLLPGNKVRLVIDVFRIVDSSFFFMSWSEIVSTLLHEMVHAYFDLFACGCATCEEDILNTTGLTGHGPSWLGLHALILTEIRSWDASLRDMDKQYSIPGEALDWYSFKVESEAYNKAAKRNQLGRYLPLAEKITMVFQHYITKMSLWRAHLAVTTQTPWSGIPPPDNWKFPIMAP